MPEEPSELLAALAAARDRHTRNGLEGMPGPLLDGLAVAARLQDQATTLLWRAIVAAHDAAREDQRAFIGCELSLQARWSTSRADTETAVALAVCALPGLVEAVEDGRLTHWHARRVLRELDAVPDLDDAQRQAIVLTALARYQGADPAALGKKVRQLISVVDPDAAEHRKQAADRNRTVSSWPVEDGQSVLQLKGGTEFVAAAIAHLREQASVKLDGDDRTLDQRMFDAAISLLTGQTIRGEQGSPIGADVHLDLVVPYSAQVGGDHELAEIPGRGPILPSTARELMAQATVVRRIAVDQQSTVLAVDDAIPGPAAKPRRKDKPTTTSATQPTPSTKPSSDRTRFEAWAAGPLRDLVEAPVVVRDLSTASYVVPRRLKRFLEARDKRCVFPTCWRPAAVTDKDHIIPWPRGRTTADELACLCRHHHRAKQASFTLTRLDDGTMRWTTRGGQQRDRPPEGF